MKYLIALISPILFFSCSNNDRNSDTEPDTDINAARAFIRAALDGNFDQARTYVLPDSLNLQDMDASERLYRERMTDNDKNKYKGASIIIHETKKVNDSTSIIVYSNTYRNQQDSLKVVKMEGKWLVDFKYIFKHKPDTLNVQ